MRNRWIQCRYGLRSELGIYKERVVGVKGGEEAKWDLEWFRMSLVLSVNLSRELGEGEEGIKRVFMFIWEWVSWKHW